jgi:hypothetical protein
MPSVPLSAAELFVQLSTQRHLKSTVAAGILEDLSTDVGPNRKRAIRDVPDLGRTVLTESVRGSRKTYTR